MAAPTPTLPSSDVQPDALFRAAADQAPQVMWIVNPKGAVTYLNNAWYQLVGGAPPRWHGHEWGEVVLPDDVAEMRLRWQLASARSTIFEGIRRVKAQDGTLHVLSYKASPVRDAQGHITCWVGMDADITQLMAAESALRFANRELETFSYSVSHDLRTPMITLQGFAGLLAKHLGAGLDPTARHYLDRISDSVSHMGRLVDGLLGMAHVARVPLKPDEVDLGAMAGPLLQGQLRAQPARQVDFVAHPGLTARADPQLMAVLLENLLGNALKFTGRLAGPARIELALANETADEKVFVLRDNGVGFDMAHAGKLFGAFQRVHGPGEFPGLGIGLATVQRIVARHGGRVWAEASPGHGASIFFALPKHARAG